MTLVEPDKPSKRIVMVLRKNEDEVVFFFVLAEPDTTVIYRKILSKGLWNDPEKIFVGTINRDAGTLHKWLLKRIFTTSLKMEVE
jgi:hypothetical protein